MKTFVILVIALSLRVACNAQEFNVFHLAIGSAHYEQINIVEGHEPFDDINGARRSARYVHELFTQNANGQGGMLRSEAGKPLTKSQILQELNKLIEMAKTSGVNNPLLLFYYCGHGISEGIAWNQFLVPGDFNKKPNNLSTDPLALDLEILRSELLYVGEVTDLLTDSGFPYMCLIDACYEGKEERFSVLENFLGPVALQNIKDIAAILRFMNKFHSQNPVIFATAPGTTTKVVPDPLLPEGSAWIGPICRKLMLLRKPLKTSGTLSLADVVMLLADSEFDEKTSHIITNYEIGENGFKTLLRY